MPAAGGWLAGKRALVVGAGLGHRPRRLRTFVVEGLASPRWSSTGRSARSSCPRFRRRSSSRVARRLSATTIAVEAALDAYAGLDILVSTVGVFDFYRGIDQLDEDVLEAAFEEIRDERPVAAVRRQGRAPGVGGLRWERGAHGVHVLLLPGPRRRAVRDQQVRRPRPRDRAHELAPRVRVNAVAPGGTVGTDLAGSPRSTWGSNGSTIELPPSSCSGLRWRWRSSRRDSRGYVFLASDRARGITGTFVHPDGGIGVKA